MNRICDSGSQKNGVNCDQRDFLCPGSLSGRCHVHAIYYTLCSYITCFSD